jgi:hypothetical protein
MSDTAARKKLHAKTSLSTGDFFAPGRPGGKNQPPPPEDVNLNLKLLLWVLVVCRRLGAIGSATTLAFARVLALATVVARLATALALT